MTLYQNSFNDNSIYLIPSDVIEFIYCKRFIYYMKCLGISQNEEKRFKVQMGRQIHEEKSGRNRDYLRAKIGAVKRLTEVPLVSEELKIKGEVDEVNFLNDGTAAPLDYKYAEYKDITFKTHKIQMAMYAIMIEEMYKVPINKAYLVYCRSANKLVEVEISEEAKREIKEIIEEYNKVLLGYYPKGTKDRLKCLDCCYRNICVK